MVGAGANVYVFDTSINVNNGTLAEGPSIMYSCLSLCAENSLLIFPQTHIRGGVQQCMPLRTLFVHCPICVDRSI